IAALLIRIIWTGDYNIWKSDLSIIFHLAANRLLILIPRLLVLLLAGATGYAIRDFQKFHATYVLDDVHLLQRGSNPVLSAMQIDQGQVFWFRFCDDYVPDLDLGSTLKTIVYEDRGHCKSISNHKLGYIVLRDSTGKPKISLDIKPITEVSSH